MADILTRAGSFIAIIFIGYFLRRKGFFEASDFDVLSKIVVRITLPAAIIYNFSGMELDLSMLFVAVLGFSGGLLYMILGFLSGLRSEKNIRAFQILNLSGYNIGNFALPFTQSFLGPAGIITTSLFDTGNAFICMGSSYAIASSVKGGKTRHLALRIFKTLFSSIPFDTYLVMIALCLLHLTLPQPVLTLAGIISNSNSFLAMLMIGVGFHLSGDRTQLPVIVRVLVLRYLTAALLSAAFYFLFPFRLEIRQALAILAFSPIASIVPAFTAELKEDVGLSSAINSMSIILSILCMVTVMSLVL